MIKRIINKKSAYALNSFSFYATAEISTTLGYNDFFMYNPNSLGDYNKPPWNY